MDSTSLEKTVLGAIRFAKWVQMVDLDTPPELVEPIALTLINAALKDESGSDIQMALLNHGNKKS